MTQTVFLHGWGTHPVIWSPILPKFKSASCLPLPGYDGSQAVVGLQAIAHALCAEIPAGATLVGWSLGGLVAMRIALDAPEKCGRLVLIGATPCFVNREDWQYGVDAEIFTQFASSLATDYAGTIRRFMSLQAQGGTDVRAVINDLRRHLLAQPKPTAGALEDGLDILRRTDLRMEVSAIGQPVTLIHGVGDKLAPVEAAHWMLSKLPRAELHEITGAAHAPFLSHVEQVTEAIRG